MPKPVTEYEVTVKIKGTDNPPGPAAIARMVRNPLYQDGYDVTVVAKIKPKPESTFSSPDYVT